MYYSGEKTINLYIFMKKVWFLTKLLNVEWLTITQILEKNMNTIWNIKNMKHMHLPFF